MLMMHQVHNRRFQKSRCERLFPGHFICTLIVLTTFFAVIYVSILHFAIVYKLSQEGHHPRDISFPGNFTNQKFYQEFRPDDMNSRIGNSEEGSQDELEKWIEKMRESGLPIKSDDEGYVSPLKDDDYYQYPATLNLTNDYYLPDYGSGDGSADGSGSGPFEDQDDTEQFQVDEIPFGSDDEDYEYVDDYYDAHYE